MQSSQTPESARSSGQLSSATENPSHSEHESFVVGGTTLNFDLTPIFLDTDSDSERDCEEVSTAEVNPHCRFFTGRQAWCSLPPREIKLTLCDSQLYSRRLNSES